MNNNSALTVKYCRSLKREIDIEVISGSFVEKVACGMSLIGGSVIT